MKGDPPDKPLLHARRGPGRPLKHLSKGTLAVFAICSALPRLQPPAQPRGGTTIAGRRRSADRRSVLRRQGNVD
jgi:hypothetical protein